MEATVAQRQAQGIDNNGRGVSGGRRSQVIDNINGSVGGGRGRDAESGGGGEEGLYFLFDS